MKIQNCALSAFVVSVFALTACSERNENELVNCIEHPAAAAQKSSLDFGSHVLDEIEEVIRAEDHLASCFIEQLEIEPELSTEEKVQRVIDFTSNAIDYVPDTVEIGGIGTKFPSRTVVDGKGDCEDKSALTALLLKEIGIKTFVFKQSPTKDQIGHVWLAVPLPGYSTSITCGQRELVAIDPSKPNFVIGDYRKSKGAKYQCREL